VFTAINHMTNEHERLIYRKHGQRGRPDGVQSTPFWRKAENQCVSIPKGKRGRPIPPPALIAPASFFKAAAA
jgi:hypothetical protein